MVHVRLGRLMRSREPAARLLDNLTGLFPVSNLSNSSSFIEWLGTDVTSPSHPKLTWGVKSCGRRLGGWNPQVERFQQIAFSLDYF
jgi:hypothetical protein